MRFEYDGASYLIEFERQQRVPANSIFGTPRHYTTAKILRIVTYTNTNGLKGFEVVRTYTVGHNPRDRFSYEAGRKYALYYAMYDAPTMKGGSPLFGKPLSKEFRTAVWKAYHGRKTSQPAS